MEFNKIYQGNSLDVLRTFPDESIDCCVTSPPYWSLRDYKNEPMIWGGKQDCEHEWGVGITSVKSVGDNPKDGEYTLEGRRFENTSNFCSKCGAWKGCLGLEPDFKMYISNLCDIFDEVKRVLKPYGTCWVNLGDTYYTKSGSGFENDNLSKKNGEEVSNTTGINKANELRGNGLLPDKCLCQIPSRFAIEMSNRGWILRNKIIWYKRSCMPSCLTPTTKIFIKRKGIIQQTKIENAKVGDNILTRNGWKKVLKKWVTQREEVCFDAGYIDKIISSPQHRFAVTKDTHKNRNTNIVWEEIRNVNPRHRFIYADVHSFFPDDKKKQIIDILEIDSGVNWFTNYRIDKPPLEVAILVGDKTLRKHYCGKHWTYASDTHNELRRGRVKVEKVKRLGGIFDKISASKSPKIENRFFEVDYDLGWLMGLYCAEGGFNSVRGFAGKITVNINEDDIITRFGRLLKQKFGVEYSTSKQGNAMSLLFTSATFFALVQHICPGGCTLKEININWILNTPSCFRQGFLDAYIDGDGHIRKEGSFSVVSASEKLIRGIHTLATSLGLLLSYSKIKAYDKRTRKTYTSYRLHTSGDHKYKKGDVAFVRPLNMLCKTNIAEMVDLEVEGSEFIIENGLVSHNSTQDRFTVDFEEIFFFVKKKQYFFNQQRQPHKQESVERACRASVSSKLDFGEYSTSYKTEYVGYEDMEGKLERGELRGVHPEGRNMRCVWDITTKPFHDAHFAVYPEDLIETPIKAGCPEFICKKCGKPREKVYEVVGNQVTDVMIACGSDKDGNYFGEGTKDYEVNGVQNPSDVKRRILEGLSEIKEVRLSDCGCNAGFEGGVVLDPFFGSGTTGVVALKNNRKYVGIELNPDYILIAEKRLKPYKEQRKIFEYWEENVKVEEEVVENESISVV